MKGDGDMKKDAKKSMMKTLKKMSRWRSASWWLRRTNERCAGNSHPQPTLAFECAGGIFFAHLLLPLLLPFLGETLLLLALLFSLLFLLCSVLYWA